MLAHAFCYVLPVIPREETSQGNTDRDQTSSYRYTIPEENSIPVVSSAKTADKSVGDSTSQTLLRAIISHRRFPVPVNDAIRSLLVGEKGFPDVDASLTPELLTGAATTTTTEVSPDRLSGPDKRDQPRLSVNLSLGTLSRLMSSQRERQAAEDDANQAKNQLNTIGK